MDRLQNLLTQLREFLAGLPPARRASFLGMSVAILAGTFGLLVWVQRPQYQTLFTKLDANDAGGVVEYLKGAKIPYRIGEDGSTIEVSKANLYEARMALAARGLPQGGSIGFEIFDKQTLGMTDFVQRLDFQRALQGELARTIMGLSAVEAARVHLALPERSLFVSEDRKPSASVVLKLRPGRSLTPEQVSGVANLVAASVERLTPSEVTSVDVSGQVLSSDRTASREPGTAAIAARTNATPTPHRLNAGRTKRRRRSSQPSPLARRLIVPATCSRPSPAGTSASQARPSGGPMIQGSCTSSSPTGSNHAQPPWRSAHSARPSRYSTHN